MNLLTPDEEQPKSGASRILAGAREGQHNAVNGQWLDEPQPWRTDIEAMTSGDMFVEIVIEAAAGHESTLPESVERFKKDVRSSRTCNV